MAEVNAKDAPTSVQVGTRIKQALEETGRSKEWLCGEAGVSLSTLNRFMGGDSDPSALEVYRIAVATKKPISWFALVDEERAEKLLLSADQFEKRAHQIQSDVEWFLGELKDYLASAAKGRGIPAGKPSPWDGVERRIANSRRRQRRKS